MQKELFLQCKTDLDALPGDPPGRAINLPCGFQMLLFCMNQAHSHNRKTRCKKKDQKEKTKTEKVKFAHLSSDARPKAGLLRKMVPET